MENLDSSSTQLTDTGHLSWTAPGSRQGDESTDEKGWKEWKEWKEYWNERKKRKEWEEWRQWKDGKGDSDSLPCVEPVRVVKEQERRPDNLSQVHDADELRTQYVLSGQPTGWSAMAKLIREYDEDKVRDCKEDIDTLLVFAGLFSAVLTAFLLESYQNLSEDTAKESLGAQRQLVLQTSSYELKGNFLNSTAAPLTPSTPFQPSPVDVCVNVLWFASLLFALTTASFGILVKQWLREYLAVQNPSPQARLRLRHLRHPELGKWKIFEIAAILPLLLQLSLALFFVGLCYFTASVHRSIGYTTLPLVAVWALCFTTVTILPLFFPRCPYRTTLLKSLIGPLHRFVGQLASGATTWSIEKAQHSAESTFKMRERLWWQMSRVSSRAAQKCQAADETRVVDIVEEDLEILADADGIQCDDELLSTTISGAAGQVFSRDKDPDKMFEFIRHILANRLQLSPDAEVLPALVVNLRNTALSLRAQNAIMDVVSRFYQEQQLDQLQWLSTAYSESTFIFALMLSASGRHVLEVPRTAPQLVLHQMTEHIGVYCCRLVLASSRSRVIEAESTVLNILDGLASLRTSFYMGYEPLHVLEWILQAWRTKVNPRCRLQNASAELCFVEDVVARTLNSTESWPWEIMSTSLQCSVVNFLLRHLEQDVEGPADSITAGTDLGTHGSLKPVNAVVLEFLLVLFYTLRHRAHRNAGRITVPSAGRIGESKNTFMLELMGADAWRAMLSRVLGTSVYLANTFALAVAFVPSDVVLYLAYHLTTVTIDEDSEPVPAESLLSHWKAVVTYNVEVSLYMWNRGKVKIFTWCLFSIVLSLLFPVHEPSSISRVLWADIFDTFAVQISKIDREEVEHSPELTDVSKLAATCLDIIRKKMLRVPPRQSIENPHDTGLRTADEDGRRPPKVSPFPELLIVALERFVSPPRLQSDGTPPQPVFYLDPHGGDGLGDQEFPPVYEDYSDTSEWPVVPSHSDDCDGGKSSHYEGEPLDPSRLTTDHSTQ